MAVSKEAALLQMQALRVELQALHRERDHTTDPERLIALLHRTSACVDAYGQAVQEYAEWLAKDTGGLFGAARE